MSCAEVGVVIHDIRCMIRNSDFISVNFVPRLVNSVAPCLVKIALDFEDVRFKFLFPIKSSTSKAATQNSSVPKVPYMTARVSHSEFSYSFPIVPGRKFVHLHFYSNSYNGLDAANAVFSVTAYNRLNATDAGFFFSARSYSIFKNFSIAQII
ncbi:hypothetical protein Q3G72_016592 [Acer saccharum]|nr:hypothetical protein Q3G72_016592 [Acer saccharum]